MNENGAFVAVSNTTAKYFIVDSNGAPQCKWQESSPQPQGNVNWLKNGKAFLTSQGGNVAAHVVESLNGKEKPPVILSLPAGPLLGRVSGDGRCLVVVQSGVPGGLSVYDMPALLGSSGSHNKPAVVLQDHDRPILAVTASMSSTHIATSNSIGAVYLHEAGSGARSTLGVLPGGPTLMTPKRCLAFSQQSKPLRLAAGADDGQVLVWQISPMASGPVIMPNKLRGRVMGVGFAAFTKVPSAALLACSEFGQLFATDVRTFPNVPSNAGFMVELNVAVNCMGVRDDGQFAAVGTKDGRVGLFKVDDLLLHKAQAVNKAGFIKVVDLGTHLDVTDIAFQRPREPRESRDHSRESRDSLPAAMPAGVAPETQQAPPADAADGSGSQRQGGAPDKQDTQAARFAPASTAGTVTAGVSQRQQSNPSTASTSGTTGNTTATRPATSTQPAAAATTGSGSAAVAGPSSQPSVPQPPGFSQPQAARHPAVPPVVIPGIAPPVGQHRRPSDVGGGNASSSTTPTGAAATAEEVVAGDGQALTSPAARAAAGAGAGVSSPVSSPLKQRSPRATVSGGGYPPARPYGSSGGDAMSAAGLRSYLDDFRQEVRDLVRGLQADMVRQAVAAEMVHRNEFAVLQQENRVLQERINLLMQQMDSNLRFGLLGQQGAPWQ